MSYDETTEISTEPSKWPGVTSLRALLDREKDEETPNLNVLLCEIFVAIYMSLLSYALASCDSQILFRLVSQNITPNYWSHIFGGGSKKTLKIETSHTPLAKELSVIESAFCYYVAMFKIWLCNIFCLGSIFCLFIWSYLQKNFLLSE